MISTLLSYLILFTAVSSSVPFSEQNTLVETNIEPPMVNAAQSFKEDASHLPITRDYPGATKSYGNGGDAFFIRIDQSIKMAWE